MRRTEQKRLEAELEKSFSMARLEKIIKTLGIENPGGLFPSLPAAAIAEALQSGQTRQRISGILPEGTTRILMREVLLGRDCPAADYSRIRKAAPAAALFLTKQDTPEAAPVYSVPPSLAAVLLKALPAPDGFTPLKPLKSSDSGELYCAEQEFPGLTAAILSAPDKFRDFRFPEEFTDDREWRNWPEKVYRALFADRDPQELEPPAAAAIITGFMEEAAEKEWRELLLPHLKYRPGRRPKKSDGRQVITTLYSLLRSIPADTWISAGEFTAAATATEEVYRLLDPDYAADYVYFETRGYYRNFLGSSGVREEQRYLDTPELYRQACLHPLTANFLGLAVVLGMTEIIYHHPNEGFSPWEGIERLRLTPWGAFVNGQSDTFPRWQPPKSIGLSSGGELAVLRNDSSRAKMLLDRIGTEIAPGMYRLNRTGILSACRGTEDAAKIIADLQNLAEEPIPGIWEDFFKSLKSSILQLVELPECMVLQLPDNPQLLKIVREDPAFDEILFRAEGRRIIVRKKHLPQFRETLLARGFLPQLPPEE